MPRLFTGLEVPPAIAAVLSSLRGGLGGARWITPDHYHVTLRFFGDIDADLARDLDHILARTMHEPFTLMIGGLRIFGGDKPRALVAEIVPNTALLELQAEQERLARRLGLAAETRKFTPHITLARLRDVHAYQVADFLSAFGAFAPLPLPVNRFVLFSSRDSVGGGPYLVEACYPLGDDPQEEDGWDEMERDYYETA